MARTNAVHITERSTTRSLWDRLQRALAPAYRLERELGGGGMSHVFLAKRPDARLVAVKVLADGAADLLELRRFRQEIAITKALQHPRILPVLDSGEGAGLAWFVTPFVGEGSLRDLLHRDGPLTLTRTVSILSDVADALAYAHACGVVHGDIKPENVLLSNSRALLADFGGARLRFLRRPLRAGELEPPVIGTPLYMSPEQAAGETAIDGRADLYSLGIVAWELLAGRPPFSAADPRSVLLAHLGTPVPPLRAHRDDAPERLAVLVERMLAKDPEDRPRSAFVVRTALDAALERPVPRRPVAPPRPVRDRVAHRGRRPLTVTALTRLAAALLGTVVTGGALAGAASLLPGPARELSAPIAAASPAVYAEPGQLSTLQELQPLVIRGHAEPAPTAAGERMIVAVGGTPAAAMPAPLAAQPTPHPAPPHPGAPPPAPKAPPAPPAPKAPHGIRSGSGKAHVLAFSGDRVAQADARIAAEIERAAVIVGREAGKLAMHVVSGDVERLPVVDTLRIRMNAEQVAAIRELSNARVALGTTLRRVEVRAEQGGRTIELLVPCAPPPPPTPPAADCAARVTVPLPAARPVGV